MENVKEISQILNYDPEGVHRGIRGHKLLAAEIQRQDYETAILFYPQLGLSFAEDAGKSQEEIDAITEPELRLAFTATGVMIED